MVTGGGFLFMSGQLPYTPQGELVKGDIQVQTRCILENIRAMLEDGGSSMDKVVKVNVYLTRAEDFQGMNEVYTTFFADAPPVRTTVIMKDFLPDIKIEIDVVALT